MARHGYAGTSLRAIAAHAGLTTGAIYAQFPGGKEELFRAILATVLGEVHSFVAAAMIGADEPVEAIVRQAGALWDFFAAHPNFAALVARESVSGALGDPSPFVAENAEALGHVRALFADAIRRRRLADVNVSEVLFWIATTCTTFHGCAPLRDAVWTAGDLDGARADFLASLRQRLEPIPAGRKR